MKTQKTAIRDETMADVAVITEVTVAAFETMEVSDHKKYSSLFHVTGAFRKTMPSFMKDSKQMASKALQWVANRRR